MVRSFYGTAPLQNRGSQFGEAKRVRPILLPLPKPKLNGFGQITDKAHLKREIGFVSNLKTILINSPYEETPMPFCKNHQEHLNSPT